MRNSLLTAPRWRANIKMSETTNGAASGLRSDAEGRKAVGHCYARVSSCREAWGRSPLGPQTTLGLFVVAVSLKNQRRCAMCISKHEVRPGVDGLLDYVDAIKSVQSKVVPLLNLIIETPLSHDGKSNFTDNDIASLVGLVNDLLDDVWTASEGIYAIYRKEVVR